MRRFIVAAALALSACTPALPQSALIFDDPPPGFVYAGATVHFQQQAAILARCGEMVFGCVSWTPIASGTGAPEFGCAVHILIDLDADMRARAERNLRARCAGWEP